MVGETSLPLAGDVDHHGAADAGRQRSTETGHGVVLWDLDNMPGGADCC